MDKSKNEIINAEVEKAEKEAAQRLLNEALNRIHILEKRADKAAKIIGNLLAEIDSRV